MRQEETSSDDEEHGERDLEDDDGFAGEVLCGGEWRMRRRPERGVDVGASGLPCGARPEEDPVRMETVAVKAKMRRSKRALRGAGRQADESKCGMMLRPR
jgi:hypothetical protein